MSLDLQSVLPTLHYLVFNLTKAVTAFIQRDSFLYWPFLLSAVAIALVVASFNSRSDRGAEKPSWLRTIRTGFDRSLWWHRSARADYRLYFANALILPALFGVVLFSDRSVVAMLNGLVGGAAFAAGSLSEPASWTSRLLFTLIFFVAYDFGRFVAHSLLHDIPILWEFHKVHHSAEKLTPMTTFRAHPLDLAVMAWVPALTTGIATWTFNQFAATRITFYSYLGLHVLIFAFSLVGILRHSHVWLHYGPRWGKWFISPAHHQLHHSCEDRHIGVNRGFELAIWDRLYGTLYVPGRKESFRMGLGDGTDEQWHTVSRMYWWPFANAGRRVLSLMR